MFHPQWREQTLANLDQPFDLVVLGGGITGCGVFFDAAQRGLRVLLVERGDIASGTSSRSSKLIHGGLRYLKQMQLRVTRMSCRERDRHLALDPNLVTPLRWIYPAYRGDKPAGWQVQLGLRVYDRLTGWPDKHAQLDPARLAELAPELPQENLDRLLTYIDGRTDDARLTLAVAATGMAHGGLVLTRAQALEGSSDRRGRLRHLVLRDLLDGRAHRVEAELVINATGSWVDRVRHLLGREGTTLRPSRGSHLLFAPETLPLRTALTLPSPDDQRPVFFVPHPEGVLVGTTDLFHHGDLDNPRPSPEEVTYLLRVVRTAFPGREIGHRQITGAFAGLRPVLDNRADDPAAASREEAIWHEAGLLSVAGGKLTTWRAMAEEVVDTALGHLPTERARRAAPCATAGTPLTGGAPRDLDQRLAAAHGLEPVVASAMARRLGQLAWTACVMARDGSELRPLDDELDLTAAEVKAHLSFGGVLHLRDLVLRRWRLGMWHPERAREALPKLRRVVRRMTGWSHSEWNEEVGSCERALDNWRPLDPVEEKGGTEDLSLPRASPAEPTP